MYDALRKYINNYTSSIISDEEFEHYYEAFTPRTVKKRQFILHENSVCQTSAFIVKGAMRQYTIDSKGVEHIVRLGIENWWMSDRESFAMATPSPYNIDAVEDCDLLVTTNEQLTKLRAVSPLFIKTLHELDLRYFISSQNRIQATLSFSAEEKFTHLMKTYPEFLQRFPQNMIASYLGITPETLSRVRKQALSK
ncbi:Crp/Fnr family transcriptional regulator [Chryseosolibacter indicus]|uniref:Crp/Fnr family transcriptional regulator n=1 Tax=Chryseosolibacter indicus TaxID=2782351 RepID=A0ABS5VRQ2_9BACT|nr:Crp/Fnr family transcriptional regulator [Chryseosolibacter indicus]MBT1704103.1 Crp/Fnr family transcriptional regulator [Chryseosolibacter indicus]